MEALVPVITSCINSSLSSGYVSGCFNSVIIIQLLKKTGMDANTFKNCRPVSNLALSEKLMEKAVACYQANAAEWITRSFQSAYRKGHSTETPFHMVKNGIEEMMFCCCFSIFQPRLTLLTTEFSLIARQNNRSLTTCTKLHSKAGRRCTET